MTSASDEKWRLFNCFFSRVGLRTYQHPCKMWTGLIFKVCDSYPVFGSVYVDCASFLFLGVFMSTALRFCFIQSLVFMSTALCFCFIQSLVFMSTALRFCFGECLCRLRFVFVLSSP